MRAVWWKGILDERRQMDELLGEAREERQRHQQKLKCTPSRGGDLDQGLDSKPWMKLHSWRPLEVLDSKKARPEEPFEDEPATNVEDEMIGPEDVLLTESEGALSS